MFFKLTNRNPFRDLVRNARRVHQMSDAAEQLVAYKELHKLLQPRLSETERYLNSQTAFCKRAEHWNQRDVSSIRAVTNLRNPWLAFKREFEQGVAAGNVVAISRALAWFSTNEHTDDWVND
jgi:hypothetical protein